MKELGGAVEAIRALSSQQIEVLAAASQRAPLSAVGCHGWPSTGLPGVAGAARLQAVPVGQKRKTEGWPSSWYTSLATEA